MIFKRFLSRADKTGMPPGELVHVGEHFAEPVRVSLITYNADHFEEQSDIDVKIGVKSKKERVRWIQVEGVHQSNVMQTIESEMHIHPLVLEDVMTTRQRPKIDDFEAYLFIVLRLLKYNEKAEKIEDEQISFILGSDYLISFEERQSVIFNAVKERLKVGKGSIRKHGADFLAYALIDSVVDNYFVLLENVGSKIEFLEEKQLGEVATKSTLGQIHHIRREIVFLKKSLWPVREVVGKLQRDEGSSLLTSTTKLYLRDVYDHSIQVLDTIDALRDLSRGLLDANLSQMSYRMNDVIRILTVVSTIFVPLTFITSIYGMNFTYMPELHWRYSYLVVWIIMVIVALFMLRYFKKKKWF